MVDYIASDVRVLVWGLALLACPATVLFFGMCRLSCRGLGLRLSKPYRLSTRNIALNSIAVSVSSSLLFNLGGLIATMFLPDPGVGWQGWILSMVITGVTLGAGTTVGQLIAKVWFGETICPGRGSDCSQSDSGTTKSQVLNGK